MYVVNEYDISAMKGKKMQRGIKLNMVNAGSRRSRL